MDASVAAALRWYLEPFGRSANDGQAIQVDVYVDEEDEEVKPAPLSLYESGMLRFRDARRERLVEHAVWRLHADVPKRSRDFVFLHAGAVASQGRALLIPGVADAGKSSLVVALLEHGFEYLSDELGAIDPITRRVYAFPKRISLDGQALRHLDGLGDRLVDREGSGMTLSQRFVRPQDVGASVADPAGPGWIVFLGSDRSGDPRLDALSRAEAAERMAANSFNLYRYRERGIVLLSHVAKEAPAFELRGGSPRERAEFLSERLT